MIFPVLLVSSALAGGFVEHQFTEFRFSPDGAYLAVAAAVNVNTEPLEGSAAVWEMASGSLVMAHDQVVKRVQFHPTLPLLRVTHPFQHYEQPIDDFTIDLSTGTRSEVGAYPFAGWTETPGKVYALTVHEDYDDDGYSDSVVRRVSMFDAAGRLTVERVQPIAYQPFEQHLTIGHSWIQELGYIPTWFKQSAATGEIWLDTWKGLYRMGPSQPEAQLVSASETQGFAMGADGRLIIADHRIVVDAVAGTKRKLPKKLLLSSTVLPGSDSVLVLSAEKDRFQVLSPRGEPKRELILDQPLAEDCSAGPAYGQATHGHDRIVFAYSPCAWHEPTQRLAVHTPEGIRLIDTTTGADVGLLDTGIDVRAVWAEQRRVRQIEEEEEHRLAVQHREEVRIAVEAREQAERDDASRPTGLLHLRVSLGSNGFEYGCGTVYVDVPYEMSNSEAVGRVRSILVGAGTQVLGFEEIGPGGNPDCAERFSSIDLR